MSSIQRATQPDTTRVDDELLTMQESPTLSGPGRPGHRRHLGTGREPPYWPQRRYWRSSRSAGRRPGRR